MDNPRRTDLRDGGAERTAAPRRGDPVIVPVRPSLVDFARRTVVAVLITLILLVIAYICWRGIDVLFEVFAGILFAVFLSALSDWLSKHARISYRWSLVIVVIALLALTAGLFWLLANRLSSQMTQLSHELPQSIEHIRDYLSQYEWGRFLLDQGPQTAGSLSSSAIWSRLGGWITGITSFLVAVVVIVFIGIFAAAEPAMYVEGFVHIVPPRYRSRVREMLQAIGYNLRWWLLGQLVLMVLMWWTTTLGLWLIGLPLALTLGLIAGIFELVPYIGPWLSAVPAMLIALLLSPYHALGVAALYLGLHLLEGYILVPLIQRRAVELPPALTLTTQVLLGELLGILGLFVAAPLTAAAIVVLKMLYVEDTLGDQDVNVPGEPGNEANRQAQAG